MKVLRLHDSHDLRLYDEPVPVPGPGEALVQVKAVGICGSDLHWFGEAAIGDAQLDRPLVLGHEFAGVIASGPRKGERVAIDPALPCNACEYCKRGDPNLCPDIRFAGHGSTDGALREFLVWPEQGLYRLPESISDAEGALLEPLGVALHTVDLGKLKVGTSVGVFGAGPIGLLILQLALLSGAAPIIVTEKLSHRLEAARRAGAAHVIQAGTGTEIQEVMAVTGGQGIDVAFEAAGENDAVEAAVSTVKPGGRVILAGIPPDDRTSFSASMARRKGLTLKLVRRMKFTYPRAIRLVDSGQVDVNTLVTCRFSLDEYQEAFAAAWRREGLKCIFEPSLSG